MSVNYSASAFSQVGSNPHISNHWSGASVKDPDYELTQNRTLEKLRYISNLGIKNSFVMATIQASIVRHVVGDALSVKLVSTKLSPKKLIPIQRELGRRLKKLDREGVRNLSKTVSQVVGAAFSGGDVLIVHTSRKPNPNNPSLPLYFPEIIDATRINTPTDLSKDGNIRLGVKYENGTVDGYYVAKEMVYNQTQPRTDSSGYTYVKAFNADGERTAYLMQCPNDARPNQTRGYPMATPVMDLIRYLENVLEAKLIRDRVASGVALVISSSNPAGSKEGIESLSENPVKNVGKIPSGSILHVQAGVDKVDTISPSLGSDRIDEYVKVVLRLICAYFGIAYEQMWLDLSSINYSSWKGGSISTQRMVNSWWENLSYVVESIVTWVLKEMSMTGVMKYQPSDFDIVVNSPNMTTLDDLKTANSYKVALAAGTKTIRQICDEQGVDYDVFMTEMRQEKLDLMATEIAVEIERKKLMEANGLEDTDASGDSSTPPVGGN